MLKIAIDTAVCEKTVFEQAVMIIVFQNSTDITFLSVTANFDNVIIFLTIEALNESAIIMIELTVFELTVKEQFIINQQIDLYQHDDIYVTDWLALSDHVTLA